MISSRSKLGEPADSTTGAEPGMPEPSMVPVFAGRTADDVWRLAADQFRSGAATPQQSRGGKTYELLHTAMAIKDPRQRWTPSRRPALNPAFAIAEVVWIVAGRNDAVMLNFFNPILTRYAGTTPTYPGAYGHRIRSSFGMDQLARAADVLSKNPDSRQVVLQIWDARSDLPDKEGSPTSMDVPCNVMSLLKVRDGRLDWTQILRSNDLILGVPHNLVQFTYLQEVLAGWLGLEMGQYTHISDSLHVYERNLADLADKTSEMPQPNTDSIAFTRDVSVPAWEDLQRRTYDLIAPNLTRAGLDDVLNASAMPPAFTNLLAILAADAARRRGWGELMEQATTRCYNPALLQLWRAWLARAGLLVQE